MPRVRKVGLDLFDICQRFRFRGNGLRATDKDRLLLLQFANAFAPERNATIRGVLTHLATPSTRDHSDATSRVFSDLQSP